MTTFSYSIFYPHIFIKNTQMVQHKIYWQNGEEDQYRLTPQVKIAYLLASFRIIQIVKLARTLVQVLPRAVLLLQAVWSKLRRNCKRGKGEWGQRLQSPLPSDPRCGSWHWSRRRGGRGGEGMCWGGSAGAEGRGGRWCGAPWPPPSSSWRWTG